MFYYLHYAGRGQETLTAVLGAGDPFRLAPYEIVERVLKAGRAPVLDSRKTDLWRANGQVYEVRLAERNFLVAMSRDSQHISVQETRLDAYDVPSMPAEATQHPSDDRTHIEPDRPGPAMKKRRPSGRSKTPSKRHPR